MSTAFEPSRTVLLVGNHLSAQVGAWGMSESLAARLPEIGWCTLLTSSRPGRVARLLDMLRAVWRWRHRYGIAHVDVFSGASFIWAEAVCRELRSMKKPFVLTLRGGNLPEFAGRWPGRVRRLFRRAAVVTTPSPYLRERLAEFRSDLLLIPNALALATYEFRLREKVRPRLVWMRAFHEVYNPTLAVRVLAALKDDVPELHLAMTGRDKSDGSRERVLRAATELGVAERLTLNEAAKKEEVPALLQQGDIYLNTPRIDNTPVTVLEAMACGLCVVSTDVGGIPYLLTHEENALLVPANDPRAMAASVRRLIADPSLARRLSENGRHAVEGFDWRAILPMWKALLDGMTVERG